MKIIRILVFDSTKSSDRRMKKRTMTGKYE